MSDHLHMLWVKSGPLLPLNTGGRRRTHAMLTELARDHRVTWLAGLPQGFVLDDREMENPYANEKHWITTNEPAKKTPRFYFEVGTNFAFSRLPYVLDRYRSRELMAKISYLDAENDFDLIICDFLTPSVNFEKLNLRTPTILFQHNVESQIWKRLADEKTNPISRHYFHSQFRRMWKAESDLSKHFDGIITVSPEDAEFCKSEYELTNVLGAVPTGVDTEFFQPPSHRRPVPGLIGFLGSMDWMPNIECVQHFVHDIFPGVLEKHPDARFRIIGRDPAPSVCQLAESDPRIEVTGTVDDVRSHLDSCEALVVPLRSGGGTRIKIFEAMAQGVPVVSTTIGAEGLPVTHENDILLADAPEDFSRSVNQLLDDQALARRLSENARRKLVEEHSWESVSDSFVHLCQKVL